MIKKLILPLLLLLGLATSCKFRLNENPNWDTDIVAPLLKSRVTLRDAIKDTTLLREDPDNFLYMVYRDTVVDLRLSEYVEVPDTTVYIKVTLDSIKLTTDTLVERLWLADMCRQMQADSDPANDFIANQILSTGNGSFFVPVPALTIANGTVIPVDASQYFLTADLLEGEIFVEVENQLPVGIDTILFTLNNAGTLSNTIANLEITNLPIGATGTDVADLSGQTVESQMEGVLDKLKTMPQFPLNYDTLTQYIEIQVILRGLKASSANAIFPAQTVIDDRNPVKYYFGDGVELTRMVVGTGRLEVEVVSTINDTLGFVYSLPSALVDGQPVEVDAQVLPAPEGDSIRYDTVFTLDGAYIDLTLNGDSVNIFPQRLLGNLIYSGNMVTMNLTDSLTIYYGLVDIIPSYVEGYLGKDTFSFQEAMAFDYFNSIDGGTLDLTKPKITFTFDNSIGADGEMIVHEITAHNRRTGASVSLNAPLVNGPVAIPGPHLPNVGQTVSSTVVLDRNNSNIRDFVSLLPDSLSFDMEVFSNSNGVQSLHNNFATDQSRIGAILDLEIPLMGIADNIGLHDTLALDLSDATVPTSVSDGSLRLYLENSFPFETTVQIYFYNNNFTLVDSLFEAGPGVIAAGAVDVNGYVSTPTIVSLESWFDQARLQNLQTNATQAIAKFRLSTQPAGQPVKIYSTYGITFRLVGDFRYHAGM